MKIFLYVVALILIAFGAAISVMSWLAPGDVLVGLTPALGASLLVGGLLLLGLGVIVAGLQELNANLLHLLYLVSEQQNAFAGAAEVVSGMEEGAEAPHEEPLPPAAPPPASTMPGADEVPSATRPPVTGDAPSPGHMAAAAAVAAMAAQGSAGDTAAGERSADSAEKPVVEDIPVVPGTGELHLDEAAPSAAGGSGGATEAPKSKKASVKPVAGKGKGPETVARKPSAGPSGGEKPAGSAVDGKTGRAEPEVRKPHMRKDEEQAAAEERAEKPATASASETMAGKEKPAAADVAEKPAGGPPETVKKEPAARPAVEKKEPPAPVMEKKAPEKAEEETVSAVKGRSSGPGRQSAMEQVTDAAASSAHVVAGKGQSAAEKIAARLEALKKETVFTRKKEDAAAAGAADGGEPPLEEALKNVVEPTGDASSPEEEGKHAGEDLLYVVEQRVIRGRSARILSDGTIEAEMDEGWLRFENREHLDEYLDALEAER